MKKYLFFPTAAVAVAGVAFWVSAVNYDLSSLGTTSREDRYVSSLTLSDDQGSEAVTISDIQTSGTRNIYVDKSDQTFTTKPGAVVTITPGGAGSWIHSYAYIDWDGDGFLYTTPDDYMEINETADPADQYKLKSGVDLVAFTRWCPSNNEQYWYNTDGFVGQNTGNNIHNWDITTPFSFTIPADAKPGKYRMRYKSAWNQLDPNGVPDIQLNNTLANDGGCIADFTLVIEGEKEPEEVNYDLSSLGSQNGNNVGARWLSYVNLSAEGSETLKIGPAGGTDEPDLNKRYAIYHDFSDQVFGVNAGKTINVEVEGGGNLLQTYIYVDWGKDGFNYSQPSDLIDMGTYVPLPGSDLVAHNGWSESGSVSGTPWYDSKGNTVESPLYPTWPQTYEIAIPEGMEPGLYRARVKCAYCSLDPNGGKDDVTAAPNTIQNNIGTIVDFTIEVIEANETHWKNIGTANVYDPFLWIPFGKPGDTWNLQVSESVENPGVYKIYDIYTSCPSVLDGSFFLTDPEKGSYMIIDTRESDNVKVTEFALNVSHSVYGEYFFAQRDPGTCKSGIIRFPVGAIHFNLSEVNADINGYYNYNTVPYEIKLPNGIVDYDCSSLGTTSREDRYVSSLTLSDDQGSEAVTISDIQVSGTRNIYVDKSDQTFTTKPGAVVTITPGGVGSWMHSYAYIDWASDGFSYTTPADYLEINESAEPANQYKLKADVDLVAFTRWCPSNNEQYWYDTNGYVGQNTGNNIHNWDITTPFSFTIPANANPGTYRMRYKSAWNQLDPNGVPDIQLNNTLANDGGCIADFTLVIEGEKEPVEVNYDLSSLGQQDSNNGYDRWMSAVKLSAEGSEEVTIGPIRQSGSEGWGDVYRDLSSQVFTVEAGKTVTVHVEGGTWGAYLMSTYVYVDWGKDGFVYAQPSDLVNVENSVPVAGSDLMVHNGWSKDGYNGTYYNSKGEQVNKGATPPYDLQFVVPEGIEPGQYRARVKAAYNSINPNGTDEGDYNISFGGSIADFTIEIKEAEIPEVGNTVIRAAVVWTDSWTDDRFGIYDYPLSGYESNCLKMYSDDFVIPTGGAAYIGDGKYFLTSGWIYDDDMFIVYHHIIETDNWTILYTTTGIGDNIARDLAYDHISGKLYGCFYGDDGTTDYYVFGSLDTDDLDSPRTVIAKLDSKGWNALSVDSFGNLYAIDREGALLKVDKGSGATTKIGDTGLTSQYLTSGAIEQETGIFYYVTCNEAGSALYAIDLTTAKAEKVYDMAEGEQVAGMYFPYNKSVTIPRETPPTIRPDFRNRFLTINHPESLRVALTIDGETQEVATPYTMEVDPQMKQVSAIALTENADRLNSLPATFQLVFHKTPELKYDGHAICFLSGEDETMSEKSSVFVYLDGSLNKVLPYGGSLGISDFVNVTAHVESDFVFRSDDALMAINAFNTGRKAGVKDGHRLSEVFGTWGDSLESYKYLEVVGDIAREDMQYLATLPELTTLHLGESSFYPGNYESSLAGSGIETIFSNVYPQGMLKGMKRLTTVMWGNTDSKMPDGRITEAGNPNILVWVADRDNAPTDARNVVVWENPNNEVISNPAATGVTGEAEAISLEAGSPFNACHPVEAMSVDFVKTFDKPTVIGKCRGWETIALPFTPEKILRENGDEIIPFSAWPGTDDAPRPFWLYTADGSDWQPASSIEAGQPYIISMPNNPGYVNDYNIKGEVGFIASNVTLGTDDSAPKATEWKGSMLFNATFMPVKYESGMLSLNILGEENGLPGSIFTDEAETLPFGAYVSGAGSIKHVPVFGGSGIELPAVSTTGLTVDSPASGTIRISSLSARSVTITAITGVTVAKVEVKAGESVCVDGLAKGIYIVAGIKIIVK